MLKLALDVHLLEHVVAMQYDGSAPKPPQRFKPKDFPAWVEKQIAQGWKIVSCYEAGPVSYGLHRQLSALGVTNHVIRPRNWDDEHKRVKTDRTDALAMLTALDRFGDGNSLTNFYDFAGRITNRQAKVGGVTTESASYQYNLNDAVTVMTDNTGSTTNEFDVAGRLAAIVYPTGARVGYGFDVLGRVTSLTNKASAGGTAYVTRYGYNATGNITNVTDPFNGVTSLEYDRVGRRTKRILPNNVVTEWQYDWRDRVTNIVHKNLDGAVLASFGYTRNAGGEPSKIVREDGTYVLLGYDAALRLTNEVYVNASSVPQTTNSYGYDASGSRVRLVKGNLTLTNSVSGGYRITVVKNGASTVESYAYDTGGRVTQMDRDSITWKLTYNAADQVASVTNSTTSTWVNYTHDASGRRTISTNSANVVRRFLVAGTPGTDLESPLLVADGNGAVRAGYVFLGDDPVLRYDTNGVPTYYLEDAMGSIAALADGNGNKTASFNYDGFGNVRSATGTTNAPTGTGGDFRFHGAWFEEGSGLYNMRAREYDARMGRFTSRDPNPGNFKAPDTLNPYSYANSNPTIFSDPSGRFTLIEVNIVSGKQAAMQAFKGFATSQGRKKALKVFGNLVKDEALKRIKNVFPMPDLLSSFEQGERVSEKLTSLICDNLDVPDSLFLEVPIFTDGTPHADGFNCKGKIDYKELGSFISQGIPRADFVLGHNAPTDGKTWVVGEIKSSAKTLYDQYGGTQEPPQFQAMMNYAAYHVHSRTALIICAIRGKGAPPNEIIQAQVVFKGMKKGALPLVVIVFE